MSIPESREKLPLWNQKLKKTFTQPTEIETQHKIWKVDFFHVKLNVLLRLQTCGTFLTITEQWELIQESRDEILLVKQKWKSPTKIEKSKDGIKQGKNPKAAEFKCGVLKPLIWRLLVCVSPNTWTDLNDFTSTTLACDHKLCNLPTSLYQISNWLFRRNSTFRIVVPVARAVFT